MAEDVGRTLRSLAAIAGAGALCLVAAAPAHAVATIAADTTRSLVRDPLAAGRSPALVAGGLDRTLLRFEVKGVGGPPARAVLRMRVTDPSIETVAVRVLPPGFAEDAATPALLLPALLRDRARHGRRAPERGRSGTSRAAVKGDGDVGLQVSGPLLDPASFSSREGPDAPQLVVTPDDARGARLAGLLDPRAAQTFVANARDDLGNGMDGLDVIEASALLGVPGRYIGVYHTLVGGVFVTKIATSYDLTAWTHRGDLDVHATQATLAGAARRRLRARVRARHARPAVGLGEQPRPAPLRQLGGAGDRRVRPRGRPPAHARADGRGHADDRRHPLERHRRLRRSRSASTTSRASRSTARPAAC